MSHKDLLTQLSDLTLESLKTKLNLFLKNPKTFQKKINFSSKSAKNSGSHHEFGIFHSFIFLEIQKIAQNLVEICIILICNPFGSQSEIEHAVLSGFRSFFSSKSAVPLSMEGICRYLLSFLILLVLFEYVFETFNLRIWGKGKCFFFEKIQNYPKIEIFKKIFLWRA